MADEEAQETEEEIDPLEELISKVATLRKLLLVATVLAIAGIAAPFVLLGGLQEQIIATTSGPLTEMQSLHTKVDDGFSNLNLAMEFHNHQMELTGELIEGVEPTIDRSQFDTLRTVMLSQEKDYQFFLQTMKDAVGGLAEMVSGPREWRDDFTAKLDSAIEISTLRENQFQQSSNKGSSLSSMATTDVNDSNAEPET